MATLILGDIIFKTKEEVGENQAIVQKVVKTMEISTFEKAHAIGDMAVQDTRNRINSYLVLEEFKKEGTVLWG